MAAQAEAMDAAASTGNEAGELERGNTQSDSPAPSSAYISSEADLMAFTRLPLEERVFTEQLRGVLAESALTGRIRYKWPLLRPLVDFVLEQVLTAYDAETRVEVGPPGPDSVSETIERFQKLLSAFSDAPWTFQRLCEILLEPKRQYSRLPKLVLAIEKCLLVTTEQPPTDPDQLPPPPLCSSLGPVNTNPPPVYTNAHHGSHGGHGAGPSGGADEAPSLTKTLFDVRPQHNQHPHAHPHGNHVGTPEHIEEDHWPDGLPEGKGGYKAPGVGIGLHGGLRPGGGTSAHPAGSSGAAGHGSPGGSGIASSSGNGSPSGSPGAHDGHGHRHHLSATAAAAGAGAGPMAATGGSHTILSALGAAGSSCGRGAAAAAAGTGDPNQGHANKEAEVSASDAMLVDSVPGAAGRDADAAKQDASVSGADNHERRQESSEDGPVVGSAAGGLSGDKEPTSTGAVDVDGALPPACALAASTDGGGKAGGDVEMQPAQASAAVEAGSAPGDQGTRQPGDTADGSGASATVVVEEAKVKGSNGDAAADPMAPVGIPPPVG